MNEFEQINEFMSLFPDEDIRSKFRTTDKKLAHLKFAGHQYQFDKTPGDLLPAIQSCWNYYVAMLQTFKRRPSRLDISPMAMKGFFDTCYLFEIDMRKERLPENYFFRMFGSRLAEVYNKDLYHKSAAHLEPHERRIRSCAVNNFILEFDAPVLVHGTFQGVRDDTLYAQFLGLPLTSTDDHMLQVFGAADFVYRSSGIGFF